MELLSIVSLLADGEFHSGSEIGARLGVSRTAVWKSLSRLDGYGLSVESIKGKGYRLSSPLQLIDRSEVVRGLSEGVSSLLDFHLFDSVDSTNTAVMGLVGKSDRPFVCVCAEMQTGGRGRRGRAWFSPFGQNIYASLAFELEGGAQSIAGLSLVAGLSVHKAVSRFAKLDGLKLKWPNDVMLNDKKLAGLLVELQGEAEDKWKVVVGIGLNFAMNHKEADECVDQPWAALAGDVDCSKSEFLSALIEVLVNDMQQFSESGFSGFVSEWARHDYFAGGEVMVLGSDVSGFSKGVDPSGNLLIETVNGVESVNAGEVSVRRG